MSRLTRDGTAEPFSGDRIILGRERGQGNINFPCSADHEQDWQAYPVDPDSCLCVSIHPKLQREDKNTNDEKKEKHMIE